MSGHRLATLGQFDDHLILPTARWLVHKADGASWQIRIDQPQSLAIGLFIRDVAAVPSRHSWLPLASPAVPRSGDQAPEAAGPQWDQWWAQALRQEGPAGDAAWPPDLSSWGTPPGFGSLDGAPELQEIVSTHFFDAVRWSEDCRQEHNATSRRSLSETWNVRWGGQLSRSVFGSPRSRSRDSISGSCGPTTFWSPPICCGTPPYTGSSKLGGQLVGHD